MLDIVNTLAPNMLMQIPPSDLYKWLREFDKRTKHLLIILKFTMIFSLDSVVILESFRFWDKREPTSFWRENVVVLARMS